MNVKKRVTACILAALILCSTVGVAPASPIIGKGGYTVSAVDSSGIASQKGEGDPEPETRIALSEENFTDANFRLFVSRYDEDNDGYLSQSEIDSVTELVLQDYSNGSVDYYNLKGIQYFTKLQKLTLAGFYSTYEDVDYSDLDLSVFTSLKELDVSNSYFKDLDFTGCNSIEAVSLKLLSEEKDSSENTILINFDQNTVKGLASLPNLKSLTISGSDLATVDLTGFSLKEFSISGCSAVTSLDFGDCTALESLSLEGLPITSFSLSEDDSIGGIIKGFSSLTNLKKLNIADNYYGNRITSVDMTGLLCPAEISINYPSSLKTVNFKDCSNLKSFKLVGSAYNIESIDLSGTNLETLSLDAVNIGETFDVSSGESSIITGIGTLTSLKNLELIYCENLATINLTGCSSLEYLNTNSNDDISYGNNSLKTLNLTGCTSLERLYTGGYDLSSLTVEPNIHLSELVIYGVSDISAFNSSFASVRKLGISGVSDLNTLNLTSENLTSLTLTGCPNLTSITFNNQELEKVDLSNVGLTSLDLDSSPKLASVSIEDCPLTFLDQVHRYQCI